LSVTHRGGNADANNRDTKILDKAHFVEYGDLTIWLTACDQNYDFFDVRSLSVGLRKYACPGHSQSCCHVCTTAHICEIPDDADERRDVSKVGQVKIEPRRSS